MPVFPFLIPVASWKCSLWRAYRESGESTVHTETDCYGEQRAYAFGEADCCQTGNTAQGFKDSGKSKVHNSIGLLMWRMWVNWAHLPCRTQWSRSGHNNTCDIIKSQTHHSSQPLYKINQIKWCKALRCIICPSSVGYWFGNDIICTIITAWWGSHGHWGGLQASNQRAASCPFTRQPSWRCPRAVTGK